MFVANGSYYKRYCFFIKMGVTFREEPNLKLWTWNYEKGKQIECTAKHKLNKLPDTDLQSLCACVPVCPWGGVKSQVAWLFIVWIECVSTGKRHLEIRQKHKNGRRRAFSKNQEESVWMVTKTSDVWRCRQTRAFQTRTKSTDAMELVGPSRFFWRLTYSCFSTPPKLPSYSSWRDRGGNGSPIC